MSYPSDVDVNVALTWIRFISANVNKNIANDSECNFFVKEFDFLNELAFLRRRIIDLSLLRKKNNK